MVYTRQDLTVMQAWPLERKIQVTQTKIMEWYYHYGGNVEVSFSGGKDSTVLLDLARRAFPHMGAAYVDTGLEYPQIRDFVKSVPNVTWLTPEIPFNKVLELYGYPVVSKEVSKRVYYARRGAVWAAMSLQGLNKDGTVSKFNQRYVKWAHLVDAPFLISEHCCKVMKLRPLHKHRKKTGAMPIVGTLASESARRQSAYLTAGCNGFGKKEPSSQPLSFWTERDILSYLQITKIPYADIYGDIVTEKGKLTTTGANRTGCMFCLLGCLSGIPDNQPMEQKIKPALPHDEIAATLDVIDRNTDVGKRDYAIILLAVVCGLRAVDIAHLKMEDIDWSIGEIRILQHKTKRPLALPLTKDVGEAVKDYIFNARPETESPVIFLRVKAPHRAAEGKATVPYGQFNTHRQRAGMKKSSFHALRRTLGSNMVISGIPVTMIAQILGHVDIESTRPYLPLNIKQLKECSLNFDGIEPDGWNAATGGVSE